VPRDSFRTLFDAVAKQTLATVLLFVSLGHASADPLSATAEGAISAYRREHGLPAVKIDAKLMQLAREQAQSMARAGVLDHNVGGSFQSRLGSANRSIAAENIAGGTHDFSSTLDLWKRSSGHRANLLKGGVTRMGVASAEAPETKYKVFWALILAGPVERRPPLTSSRARRALSPRLPPHDLIKYCGEAIPGMARVACE